MVGPSLRPGYASGGKGAAVIAAVGGRKRVQGWIHTNKITTQFLKEISCLE